MLVDLDTISSQPSDKTISRLLPEPGMDEPVLVGSTGPQSPTLRRTFTEPNLKSLLGDVPASYDGSDDISRVRTGSSLMRPESTGSVWKRAFREHEEEKRQLNSTRSGSILHLTGHDDLQRQARKSRQLSRTPSFSVLVSDEISRTGHIIPAQETENTHHGVYRQAIDWANRTTSVPTRSTESWLRFSSDTFIERPGLTGTPDRVITRDFAETPPSPDEQKPKAKGSILFHKKKTSRWRLFRSRTKDCRRYQYGHHNSISLSSRQLTNPDLGTLPPAFVSPCLRSETSALQVDAIRVSLPRVEPPPSKMPQPQRAKSKQATWELNYNDCVYLPPNSTDGEEPFSDESGGRTSAPLLAHSTTEPEDLMRENEWRARYEALEAVERVYRNSVSVKQ
ncbi:MAG: hypothetical protein Q9190_001003 [Brigantiaea leucoxantha]